MTVNYLYSLGLAALAGVIVGEAYKAGARDAETTVNTYLVAEESPDLPTDDEPANEPEPTPNPDGDNEE
jgi:hypothetical protein